MLLFYNPKNFEAIMTALIEIIFDGIKKFGGEIIAAILLAIAFGMFPSLRKLFRKKKYSFKN